MKFTATITRLLISVGLLQILLGLIFTLSNFNAIPNYGDTKEYIELSLQQQTDSWRVVFYPYLIATLKAFFPYKFHFALYSIQSLMSLLAFFYIVDALLKNTLSHLASKQRLCVMLFVSLSLWFNPLITHFNLTILTDSFCLTFLLIYFCSLTELLRQTPPNRSKYLYLICSLSFFLMCLTRAEKLYFGLLATGVILTLQLLINRHLLRSWIRYNLSVVATIIFSTLFVIWTKSLTSGLASGRTNMESQMIAQFLKAGFSTEIIWGHVKMSLRYLLSPYVFIKTWSQYMWGNHTTSELVAVIGGGTNWSHPHWATLWTASKLLAQTPFLARAFLLVYAFGLGLQTISAVYFLPYLKIGFKLNGHLNYHLLTWIVVLVVHSSMFGFMSDFPCMHIRYGLPGLASFHLLLIFLLTVLLSRCIILQKNTGLH